MSEPIIRKDVDYMTAPDLSFTTTRAALYETQVQLVNNPIFRDMGRDECESHIFAMLTMNEGYNDGTATQLAGNPYFRAIIHEIYDRFKEWRDANHV